MTQQVNEAIEVIKNGGIVIFPTDTAIGIGCRIDRRETIRRLFQIRQRPENKPLLVLVSSVKMAEEYLVPIPKEIKDKLINRYWPGKLTIVWKCKKDKVPFPVRDQRATLGVRFPNDKTLLELINGVGVPIVAPSANFSGEKTPFNFEEIDPKLVKSVDFILEEKPNLDRNVSTIIDCTVSPWKVIREGVVRI